jgi:glycosyltransferase involved in cell wall biosynthesis
MHLQLLISTCNQGIQKVQAMLLPPIDDVSYLISHQYVNKDFEIVPPALLRDDVKIIKMNQMGLSANRNNCLRYATGDVLMILDDDVKIYPEYLEKVREFFNSGDVDVACGKIKTRPDEPEYKDYPSKEHQLEHISQLKAVSSIEISLRKKSIIENGIWFDERFGLGSLVSSGEELLFLNECLKKGLKIKYFPEYTVEHSCQSSVKKISAYSDERLFVAGAQAYALYGKSAYVRNFLSAFKRLKVLTMEYVSPWHFLKIKNSGSFHLSSLDSSRSRKHK